MFRAERSPTPKRKRARLESDGGGMFSFFTRTFYRNAPPTDAESDDGNNTENDCDPVDYDERGLRRVKAVGLDARVNDVLLRVARTAGAAANVVFFPGDVQDFHSSMIAGSYAEYDAFSYEHTADLLAAKFGDSANVWIVRPSRFQFGAYACFDGFVDTNSVGAATSYLSNGSAVEQLATMMESVRTVLEQEQSDEQVSTNLPVHLVGFSKGGIVLNQLATELASRWNRSAADKDLENNNTSEEIVSCLVERISSIHWLDSGNGSKRGAVPTDERTLLGLSSLRSLQLCVHVTPYQFESRERPWIKNEVVHCVASLKRLGANVALRKYAENESATLACHFQILKDFHLPISTTLKTGQAPSPEVPVARVAIQTVQ